MHCLLYCLLYMYLYIISFIELPIELPIVLPIEFPIVLPIVLPIGLPIELVLACAFRPSPSLVRSRHGLGTDPLLSFLGSTNPEASTFSEAQTRTGTIGNTIGNQ